MKRGFLLALMLCAALSVTVWADVIGPVEYAVRSGVLPAVLVVVAAVAAALILRRRK